MINHRNVTRLLHIYISQRSSGLVTYMTVVCNVTRLNPTISNCVFSAKAAAIYSLGHGLQTITAVFTSNQPSALHGMVKLVLATGLVMDGLVMVDVDGSSLQADSRLMSVVFSEGQQLFYIHQMNWVNSHNGRAMTTAP